MTFSHFPNGFNGGLVVRGVPIVNAYGGDVYWVKSGPGLRGDGTFKRPWTSIEAAFNSGKLKANNGDILMVAAGHTEEVSAAAGITLDIAGVAIVGLGAGSSRPTINFTTAVGADMNVDAANITISNILFTGGIDALTGPIDINAADFTMLNCETRDVTGQATDFIVADANADRLYIDGWIHRGAAAAGAASAITFTGGDGAVIKNFWIDGNFSAAAIRNLTTAATNVSIYGDRPSFARTRNAADIIVTLVATTTGNVGPNIYARLADDATNITEAFVGADAQFFQPIAIVNADGESSTQTDITASTG